ncbi:MAG TPA: FHA domain-containing protein [Solirubrobacterales bacterium]|nr:FHA domain-containing protein [Solirubrobacterales bacterium]
MRSERAADRFESGAVEPTPTVNLILPDGSTCSIPLEERITSFGRHPHSTVVIDDPTVSSTHLTLERVGGQIKVRDESSYGTRLQGALLVSERSIKVHHGQSITFGGDDQGRYQLVVRDPSEHVPTEPPRHRPDRIRLPAPLQRIAEALVYQYVERVGPAPRAASVEEIAERLEVHPATIRRGLHDLESILKIDADLRGPKRQQALAERILLTDAHRS